MLTAITTVGAVQVLGILVGLTRSKLLAVLLGPAGIGIMSLIDQVAQLTLFVSGLSLPSATIRFLARSHSLGPAAFQRSYSGFLRLLACVTAGGAVVAMAVTVLLPSALGGEVVAYRHILVPALAALPFMALHGFIAGVLAAAGRSVSAGVFAVVVAMMLTATAVVGVTADAMDPLRGLYWANLAGGAIMFAAGTQYVRRTLGLRLGPGRFAMRAELKANPDVLTFALMSYVPSFTVPLAYLVARREVLVHHGERETGLLHAAFAIATSLALVVGPMTNVYLVPLLNRAMPAREKAQLAFAFSKWLIVVMVVTALPAVLFPEWLLILLYSKDFIGATAIVPVYVGAVFLQQLASVAQAALVGLDDVATSSGLTVLGNGIFALLVWLLVPELGLIGVPVSLAAGAAMIVGLGTVRLAVRSGCGPDRRLLALALYGLLALLAAGEASRLLDASSFGGAVARVGGGVASLAILTLCLDAEQRRQLRETIGAWLSERRWPGSGDGQGTGRRR